jgi:uncharacterized membrane protein (UPF0127 family)
MQPSPTTPEDATTRARTIALAAMLLCASGCATAGDPWVELAGERYAVEVADDPDERARGLMFRDMLADGTGMLFIHDDERRQSYWMKNTRIPLDILYFDASRRLVTQQRDVPPCRHGNACPSYPSRVPALYVLELNAGEAARLGLQDGAEITFGPGIGANR